MSHFLDLHPSDVTNLTGVLILPLHLYHLYHVADDAPKGHIFYYGIILMRQ